MINQKTLDTAIIDQIAHHQAQIDDPTEPDYTEEAADTHVKISIAQLITNKKGKITVWSILGGLAKLIAKIGLLLYVNDLAEIKDGKFRVKL